jgi:hypothetical protein
MRPHPPRFLLVLSLTSIAALMSSCALRVRPSGAVVIRPAPVVYVAPASRPPPPAYAPAPTYAPPPAQGYPPPPPATAPPQAACIDPGTRDISELYEQAMPLAATSTTVGCIARNDIDTFVITAPPGNAGQIVQYSLRGQYEMAPVVQVLDANRAPLNRHNGPKSTELRGWVHVTGGTPFYLRVSQVHGANEAYTLTLAATAMVEPGEPNSDMTRATVIREGTPVQGFMSQAANDPSSLNDWYRLDVTRDGPVTLDVDMSQDIAPVVEVFNVNRRKVAYKSGSRSERIQLGAQVQRGTYYILVRTFHSVASAGVGDLPPWLTRPYTLSVLR